MLATLNAKQIADEIVKDAIRDNDPHDAVHIAPEIVLASRSGAAGPTLAPEIDVAREARFGSAGEAVPAPNAAPEPGFASARAGSPTAPDIGTALRVPGLDDRLAPTRSGSGKWLRGALVTLLCAGASAAATVAWDRHGDAARQMLAEWTPAVASLGPARSQTAQATDTAAITTAAPDQSGAAAEATQLAAPPPAPASSAESNASMPSMTRDLAAMAQQIEQLKASLAELKAGQEQMAREMAKPPATKPVADARPAVDAHARLVTPPRPPVPKPKPPVTRTYMPSYAPPPQAAVVPPPPPPATTSKAVADDDGPVVRPPMPLR
jgi:hypothetical protein